MSEEHMQDILYEMKKYHFENIILDDNEAKFIYDYINSLQQENQQLKSKLECYENGVYFDSRVDDLENQLKQRDGVIDEAIKLLKEKTRVIPFDKNGEGGGLELVDYDIQELSDNKLRIIFNLTKIQRR